MQTNRISTHLTSAPRFTMSASPAVPPGFTQLPHFPMTAVSQEMQDLYRWAYEQAQQAVREQTASAHLWN